MKTSATRYFIVILLLLGQGVMAQDYQTGMRIALPSGDFSKVMLADFDNDTLLDVLVHEANSIVLLRKDPDTLVQRSVITTGGVSLVSLADVNADNFIDIVISDGTATKYYQNAGDFVFSEQPMVGLPATAIAFADLDGDGGRELVLGTDAPSGRIFIFKGVGSQWTPRDTIMMQATSIALTDLDGDGDNDIFVSGKIAGQRTSAWFDNHRGEFLQNIVSDIEGAANIGDLNRDGQSDVLLMGVRQGGSAVAATLLNSGGSFIVHDTLPALVDGVGFIGDFDNDGGSDISILGDDGANLRQNILLYATQSGDTISPVLHQAFGDLDRDGDLDLVQLLDSTADSLNILWNSSEIENADPLKPSNVVAALLYDRIFVMWEEATDDHTTFASLTYDVNVHGTAGDVLVASYDQMHYRRLLVSHGNRGHANFVLLKAPGTDAFEYEIQAVDNAYNGGNDGPNGICKGIYGGAGQCEKEITTAAIGACDDETVILNADAGSHWFSFADGYLGKRSSYEFTVSGKDTLFSVAPSDNGCPLISIYTIDNTASGRIFDSVRYVCNGQDLLFEAPAGASTEWRSASKGFLSNAASLPFEVTGADTVFLNVADANGCTRTYRWALKLSAPALSVPADGYQILKGESVQLSASGAESYLWSPAGSLNDPATPSPLATPAATTEYKVVGRDSIGCQALAIVTVFVEFTAFIPNLFTPNDDGKNDELKVYGLSSANGFQFSIYNREGSLVFSASDVAEASQGWNGMVRGVKQPPGVYYWQVKGESDSGTRILLNGKTSGSLVLVR